MSDYRVKSSGLKSADAAITSIGSKVHAVELISDGTNTASLVVYDAASAVSGSEVLKIAIAASTTAPQIISLNDPVVCHTGIYADVSGTGANYIIHYSIGD